MRSVFEESSMSRQRKSDADQECLTLPIIFRESGVDKQIIFNHEGLHHTLGMTFEPSNPRVVASVPAASCAQDFGVKPGMTIVAIAGVQVSAMEPADAALEIRRNLVRFNTTMKEAARAL